MKAPPLIVQLQGYIKYWRKKPRKTVMDCLQGKAKAKAKGTDRSGSGRRNEGLRFNFKKGYFPRLEQGQPNPSPDDLHTEPSCPHPILAILVNNAGDEMNTWDWAVGWDGSRQLNWPFG
jgi:hypothetical protein